MEKENGNQNKVRLMINTKVLMRMEKKAVKEHTNGRMVLPIRVNFSMI